MAAAQEILIAPGKSSFLIACSIQKPGNFGVIFRVKARPMKIFERKLFIRTLSTTILQIFLSKFNLTSMTGLDNNGQVDLQA